MPNYCKSCCEKRHIEYDPTGKTCYAGMTCDGCDCRLNWFEEMDTIYRQKMATNLELEK